MLIVILPFKMIFSYIQSFPWTAIDFYLHRPPFQKLLSLQDHPRLRGKNLLNTFPEIRKPSYTPDNLWSRYFGASVFCSASELTTKLNSDKSTLRFFAFFKSFVNWCAIMILNMIFVCNVIQNFFE